MLYILFIPRSKENVTLKRCLSKLNEQLNLLQFLHLCLRCAKSTKWGKIASPCSDYISLTLYIFFSVCVRISVLQLHKRTHKHTPLLFYSVCFKLLWSVIMLYIHLILVLTLDIFGHGFTCLCCLILSTETNIGRGAVTTSWEYFFLARIPQQHLCQLH